MGCCVSCRKAPSSDSAPPNQNGVIYTGGSRASPLMEEETVKEVLSVTPTPKPVLLLTPEKETQKPVLEKIERDDEIEKIVGGNVVEEMSEVSEICSLSESFSAATVTGKTDENEEVNQKLNGSPAGFPKNQSHSSGNVLPKRNVQAGKSPTGRSDQSPARRHHGGVASVRIVQNRDSGGGMARRNAKAEVQRRDPRDISARRSRSPATARIETGANRSSVVRSGRSPGRAATVPPEHTQKETEEVSETDVNRSHDTTNESLENPLVSLECFIFL